MSTGVAAAAARTAAEDHPAPRGHRRRAGQRRAPAPSPGGREPVPPTPEPLSAGATRRWWNELSDSDRVTVGRVARGGGFLRNDLSRSLVGAGVDILMPDDVRAYIQLQYE